MKNKLGIGIVLLLTLVFFGKMMRGLVPIPLDAMVGAYYPWYEKIPVKNIAISDVFSQLYPWRRLAVNLWKQREWPLWNPYSLSGTPLLANWQSAPFYPLNGLMVIFGDTWGWSLMIALQVFISGLGMWAWLTENKLSTLAAVVGSVIYSFGGFMLIFLTYGTLGQVACWIPWILLVVLRLAREKRLRNVVWLSWLTFLTMTAGSIQISIYALGLALVYGVYLFLDKKLGINFLAEVLFGLFLGIGMSAVCLWPTLELFGLAFRGLDRNIINTNFGLIPLKALITFLSPDYFGNPTTNNFRGFLYHETTFYFGVTSFPLVIYGLMAKGRLRWFLALVTGLALALVFDWPVGRLVYQLNIPIFSTSYASRLNIVMLLGLAGLAAVGMDGLLKRNRSGIFWSLVNFLLIVFAGFWVGGTFWGWWRVGAIGQASEMVSLRNLAFSAMLAGLILVANMILRSRTRWLGWLWLGILVVDLFHFGWKYTPFVTQTYDFPKNELVDFLKKNIGNYRMDRERSEILPPNTWMQYGLMSPSGYDPLYSLDYSYFYKLYNQENIENSPSRYAELVDPMSPVLDLVGVKYVVRLNNSVVNLPLEDKYREVWEKEPLVVLENKKAWYRAATYFDWKVEPDTKAALRYLKSGGDFRKEVVVNGLVLNSKPIKGKVPIEAKILEYSPNQVKLLASGQKEGGILFLSDTDYPGWRVWVNGVEGKPRRAFGVFRAVEIPPGESEVIWKFQPKSFFGGLWISVGCFIISCLVLVGSMAKGLSGHQVIQQKKSKKNN